MTTHLDTTPTIAEVYWRPGCPYCSMLRRDRSRRGVPTTWHNIWEDEPARRYVRQVNHGNETVPTVRVGTTTMTNPRGAQVAALLGIDPARLAPKTRHPRTHPARLAHWMRTVGRSPRT